MSDTPFRLAIDFDSVIHDPNNVEKGYKMGKPIVGAQEALQGLHRSGAIIVIHSVWADSEKKRMAMAEWCHFFDIPYDFITNTKPVADVYIDDHGYRFENWSDTLKFLANYRA